MRKPILGYERYSVDENGVVYSISGAVMKPLTSRGDYLHVNLYRSGISRSVFIHVLVLETFVGPRPAGMYGCHCDGNPHNNALSNLRWDTPRANERDKGIHGTKAAGTRNGRAKLTDEQVRQIVASKMAGGSHWGVIALAKKFAVSRHTISRIANGGSWKSVTGLAPLDTERT